MAPETPTSSEKKGVGGSRQKGGSKTLRTHFTHSGVVSSLRNGVSSSGVVSSFEEPAPSRRKDDHGSSTLLALSPQPRHNVSASAFVYMSWYNVT